MKRLLGIIVLVMVALAAGYYGAGLRTAEATNETAYERVLRTNTLRCGYMLWPDILDKDPNTGALSGIMYDYMTEFGKLTGLTIEWTEQVTPATLTESVSSGRIDATCLNTWPNAARGRYMAFTAPIFYNKIFPIVRADDARFDASVETMNDPTITIMRMDGEVGSTIAESRFPHAESLDVPGSVSEAEMLTSVATGKADVLFLFRSAVLRYNQNNPQAPLKTLDTSLATIPCGFGVANTESALNNWLSVAIEEMGRTGKTHAILAKHGAAAMDYFENP